MQIKATREGFILVPDPDVPFEAIRSFLESRLEGSRDFFLRSEMILDLRGRSMQTSEIAELHEMLVVKALVKMVEVKLAEDLSFVLERTPSLPSPQRSSVATTYSQDAPVIVRSTCRSGVRVESSADCVILGDVNPGAEVVAVGDVIVFGSLRGIAHAGALGDRSARIWALSIEPSQIRIADLVALPPRGGKSLPRRYEIAEVQDDLIEVIAM
jgi:septum site-determining protein MinC